MSCSLTQFRYRLKAGLGINSRSNGASDGGGTKRNSTGFDDGRPENKSSSVAPTGTKLLTSVNFCGRCSQGASPKLPKAWERWLVRACAASRAGDSPLRKVSLILLVAITPVLPP